MTGMQMGAQSLQAVIASAAKQSIFPLAETWIASSLALLAKMGWTAPERHQCARLVVSIRPDKETVHEED
jgi:hypothetical protein